LVKINPKNIHSAQNEAYHYLGKLADIKEKEVQKSLTINEEYGFSSQQGSNDQKYTFSISTEGLNPDQMSFFNNILKDHTNEYIQYAVELMKNGYTNEQAKEKADKDKNV
jgi:phosphotransacetylase